jgi:hypothetical protein
MATRADADHLRVIGPREPPSYGHVALFTVLERHFATPERFCVPRDLNLTLTANRGYPLRRIELRNARRQQKHHRQRPQTHPNSTQWPLHDNPLPRRTHGADSPVTRNNAREDRFIPGAGLNHPE